MKLEIMFFLLLVMGSFIDASREEKNIDNIDNDPDPTGR